MAQDLFDGTDQPTSQPTNTSTPDPDSGDHHLTTITAFIWLVGLLIIAAHLGIPALLSYLTGTVLALLYLVTTQL